MSKKTIFLDNFSGSAVDLKKEDRTPEKLLSVLAKDPMISTWDLSENYKWLLPLLEELINKRLIFPEKQPYPWHKYTVTKNGHSYLA